MRGEGFRREEGVVGGKDCRVLGKSEERLMFR